MEKLSPRKKLTIVRLYLSGLSYEEIAAKNAVSKGTVANVVVELKAGVFPEAADGAEQIGLMRELSTGAKTPGHVARAMCRRSGCPEPDQGMRP